MWDVAGQEHDPAGLELPALVADPHSHSAVEEQEGFIVASVDMHGRGVAAMPVRINHRQLPSSDGAVENHAQLTAAQIGEPLMLVGLTDVRLQVCLWL